MQLLENLTAHALGLHSGGVIGAVVEDTRPSLPSSFLRRVLDMRDSLPEQTRLAQPGYIHLSSLVGICPRQWVMMLERGIRTEDGVTGGHRVMWKIGRAVEHHVREQLIHGYPSAVYGLWRCTCGRSEHRGFRPRAGGRCAHCQTAMVVYHELTLLDHEHGVSGNPDLILRHEEKYLPVEIKSMNKEEWEELSAPKPNHIIQATGYRRLMEHQGLPVHEDVALIYTTKDFKFGSPYKEFHVRATAARRATLDELFAVAREIKEARENGTVPPRVCCTSERSPRARKCPVKLVCFDD